MKRTAFAFAVTFAMGSAALAAGGAARPKDFCRDFSSFKTALAQDDHDIQFRPLSAAEYHFVEGIYAMSPLTPPGLPPGDAAQIVQSKNSAAILWTRGKLACLTFMATGERDEHGHPKFGYGLFPLAPAVIKMLPSIVEGVNEVAGPDPSELRI